jgi:hypothetical protein
MLVVYATLPVRFTAPCIAAKSPTGSSPSIAYAAPRINTKTEASSQITHFIAGYTECNVVSSCVIIGSVQAIKAGCSRYVHEY